MDGETEQSAFDELVEMDRQYGPVPPDMPESVDTEIMRQPLVYEDTAEPTTRTTEAATPETNHPFELVDASSGGTANVRVYSGVAAALDPVSNGPFNAGDSPAFTVTVSDGNAVYVDISVAYDSGTGTWSATAFTVAAAGSLPAASATHAYYPIGSVTVASGNVTAIGGGVLGNIGWRRCGDSSSYSDEFWAGP